MSKPIFLWLDDVRPAPEGWVWCKTVGEAIEILSNQTVQEASLDHDLGVCQKCNVVIDSLYAICKSPCCCDCHATGYDLVKWMAKTDTWSIQKPVVHSANPVGAAAMRQIIDRYWK